MRKHAFSRLMLIVIMMIGMMVSVFPARVHAESSDWTPLSYTEISDGDVIAVTMAKDESVWILPTAATGRTPAADTAAVAGGVISASRSAYGWTFKTAEGGFTIAGSEGYLNSGGANNGLRANGAETVWTLDEESGYLKEAETGRYMGVYNSQDWRTYTTVHNNIAGETLSFWKYTGSGEEEPPAETELTDIAAALAGETGTEFKVKGVVTLVDGRNIYIQDATGGIDLYLAAADDSVSLGDTLIGTGTRAVYRGLPELSNAVIEKSSGMTLEAKETAIGALSEADVCTYISLKGVEVTEVYDNNGAYANPNITVTDGTDSIQIYKAVISKTGDAWDIAAGDKVDIKAAVGINNTTLQLRNTLAEEIVKAGADPEEPEEKKVLVKMEEAPADGTQAVIYHPSSNKVLSAEASGTRLAGVDAELKDNEMALEEGMAYLNIHVKDEQYLFEYEGKYLTSGETGNSLTFADDQETDLAKWTLTQQEDGTWYIMNVGAAYNEQHNQALEYYNGFTTYGVRENNAAYKFDFYTESDEPEHVSISEALAGETGAEFTVKGVVTLVDGRNIYIQDSTGGIDLYLAAADDSVSLGDTLIGTGTRAVYRGLPELSNAVIEKSSGMTLEAKETAIGALTESDVCTYISLKGVEVTEVYDNNGAYANPNITVTDGADSIQIYKAVISKTGDAWDIAAGDKVDIKAAVGINNTTLQLRNTLAEEIVKASDEPAPEYSAIAEALAGENGTEFTVRGVVTLVDGRNIYIQDSTGGIDLYLAAADDSVKLGDTLIGTGSKTVYRGLPELADAVIEKSSGLTLEAKETTIGALSTADVCTYISLKGVEVTEVYDNNGAYTNPNITVTDGTNTIQLYKAVVNKTDGNWDVSVGDTLNIKAAVGIYNTTLQLRNTLADEIEIVSSEPEDKGDMVTDLSQLTDGTNVVIYSRSHKTVISSKPNGDWYLKAEPGSVENNRVTQFTEEMVWTVKVNEDSTYSFYGYNHDDRSITVWPSGNYAELSVNYASYPDNTWTLTPAKTADCFYMNSPTVSGTNGPAYVEAYLRNGTEVFSGYFTSPSSNRFTESEFALTFYLVNGEDAVPPYDDGEWDGVLNKGEQYMIYNDSAASTIGLLDEANFSMKAIPSEVTDGVSAGGNGTYVFTVDTTGRYYTFMTGGKYLATNNSEDLLLEEPKADGSAPENAKWFLTYMEGTDEEGETVSGYILYNKDANYNGTPVCIEYYSSVFSGWTYSTRNPLGIYVFEFVKPAEDVITRNDIVQAPSILIDSGDFRYVGQDYEAELSLDDLAESVEEIEITFEAGEKTGTVTDYEGNDRTFSFTIPAEEIDGDNAPESFTLRVTVTNSYGITYSAEKVIEIRDEPFISDMKPAANSQTGDDLKPVISAKVLNAGENPEVSMEINGEKADAVFEDGVISYTPAVDLPAGRTEVRVTAVREDGKSVTAVWTFTAGYSDYQLYFGQLHSHTTYSDGSGSLDAALDYIASLPESANVDFVAFTDHSNYFDSATAANPAAAMNDASLMTDASRALWNEYKEKAAAFNAKQSDVIAIAGYEMTWSGGPGHINSYNTDGLVSRNNAELNNKTNDAGMKLYYQTMNNDDGETLHQFNHPGTTFGNFTDFSYWDEQTDDHMFLVEVGNGEGQIGAGGYYPSYEEYTLALDQGWHVAPTNNQDNHKGRWGNANDARDVILTNDFSEQGIYDAIRQRRVYATEDKNLSLTYTLNGEVMGTIIEDLDPSEKIHLAVTIYDPDEDDSTAKVEVIANSGTVAYTWDDPEALAEGSLEADLDPQYTYYYIRVTQADGNLAVTAPVWTGKAARIGISGITVSPEQLIVNEPAVLTTELYNEEYPDATVTSVTYTVDGAKILGTDTEAHILEGEGTLEIPFTFTPDTAKRMTITVTAVIDYEGTQLKVSKDITVSVRETAGDLPVTDIADVMKVTEAGYEFAIEGVVVSNASGYDKDTAFFDCIYVEDETGGICCFPVSGEFKIGDKVHVEGYTDFYQGEPELQVESIEVIGSGTVEPQEVTAEQINDLSVLGKLVTIKGTVESFEAVNGLIQTIMVKDEAGNTARVFIDGYITTGYDVENCAAGVPVTATGLASYDDTWPDTDHFARIRIRDRKDVVCGGPLEISETEAEIPTRTTLLLSANKPVTWTSSDEKIATVDENGLVTALRYGRATITATAEDGETATCEIQTRYYDVNDDSKYYWKPVYWAADNVITKGYDNVYFGPQNNCTREAVVTFLWRLAGQPEPKSTKNPFKDVQSGKYYYKAVLWAAENGITKGYKDGTFRPDDTCLREHVVTFLYRYAGSPSVKPVSNPFNDVKVSDYYYRAAVWANQEGIANGYSEGEHAGGFGPKLDCLREHVVTFLYRYAVK